MTDPQGTHPDLVAVPNPEPGRDYEVRCETPEFTCVCPMTGQPDFATITITYVPDAWIVELKSLKGYLWQYRQVGTFHEAVTNKILDDLIATLHPRRITVRTDWLVRGGIHTVVEAGHPPAKRVTADNGWSVGWRTMSRRYWVETLGCPKNEVDSAKLVGTLVADGYQEAEGPEHADLVVVNTCAFVEAARQESIDTVLALADVRRDGARLVVTGCMAECYGAELAAALPEVDQVSGFNIPVTLGKKNPVPEFDLLNLPRPKADAPWAYVKVAEGCDRLCGFCAIPSFRGKQRSRTLNSILDEVDALEVAEIVLVAQDLASYGRDIGRSGDIIGLVKAVSERVARTRLLYLYPSELTDGLIEVMGDTACPYFDLSLQHASRPHLRRMRRWGDGARFGERIATIRRRYPEAAFRSSFIVGYPGETEDDHDQLLLFLEESQLDWAGFFPFSSEAGTYAATLPDVVAPGLVAERLLECGELQDGITAAKRLGLVGRTVEVLVDRPGQGRSHREAPEIDGIIQLPAASQALVGRFVPVLVTGSAGPDLDAELAVVA